MCPACQDQAAATGRGCGCSALPWLRAAPPFILLRMRRCVWLLQAADIVRIMGIGRNEYIAVMVQVWRVEVPGAGSTCRNKAG